MAWRTTAEPMKPAPPVTRSRLGMGRMPVVKRRGEGSKAAETSVLVGQDRRLGLNRPRDVQGRIVPDDAAVQGGLVIIVDLVGDLGLRFEGAIAVSETARDEELLAARGGQR